jgi:hypothetical protein
MVERPARGDDFPDTYHRVHEEEEEANASAFGIAAAGDHSGTAAGKKCTSPVPLMYCCDVDVALNIRSLQELNKRREREREREKEKHVVHLPTHWQLRIKYVQR